MKKLKLVTRSFLSVAKTQSRQERNSENRNKNLNASVIITRKDSNREAGGQSNALLRVINIDSEEMIIAVKAIYAIA